MCRSSASTNWQVQKSREIAPNVPCAVDFEWVPDHQGIPGNERAHEMARGMLHAEDHHSVSTAFLVGEDDEDGWANSLLIGKMERKRRVKDLLSSDEDALPSTYTRWRE